MYLKILAINLREKTIAKLAYLNNIAAKVLLTINKAF